MTQTEAGGGEISGGLPGISPTENNERQPTGRKRSGPCWSHRPHYTQEGPTQIQAEADSHVQEQGAQTGPEGLRRRHPRHGGSRHGHHGGVPVGSLRRHGAQRLGQIRHHLKPLSSCPLLHPCSACQDKAAGAPHPLNAPLVSYLLLHSTK